MTTSVAFTRPMQFLIVTLLSNSGLMGEPTYGDEEIRLKNYEEFTAPSTLYLAMVPSP
jgi:hypothetical protein